MAKKYELGPGHFAVTDNDGNILMHTAEEPPADFRAFDVGGKHVITDKAGNTLNLKPYASAKPDANGTYLKVDDSELPAEPKAKDGLSFWDTVKRNVGSIQSGAQKMLLEPDKAIPEMLSNVGDSMKSNMQEYINKPDPRTFLKAALPVVGNMATDITDPLSQGKYGEAAGNLVTTAGQFALPEIPKMFSNSKLAANAAKESIISKGLQKIPNSLSAEEKAGLASLPHDAPLTVADTTGNPLIRRAQNFFGGQPNLDKAAEQKSFIQSTVDSLVKQFNPNGMDKARIGDKIASSFFDAKDKVANLYGNFRGNHIENPANQIQGFKLNPDWTEPTSQQIAEHTLGGTQLPPKFIPDTIKGPIRLTNTVPLAESIFPDLEKLIGGDNFKNLPDADKNKVRSVYSYVKDIIKPGDLYTDAQGQNKLTSNIKEWDAVKQIRTNINDMLRNKTYPDKYQSILGNISKSLEDDVNTSISSHFNNGTKALEDLNKANDANTNLHNTFNDNLLGKLFNGNPKFKNASDMEGLFSSIKGSPDTARQVLAAARTPGNQRLVKGSVLGDVLKNATDKAKGVFSADQVINSLDDPEMKVMFTQTDRSNIENTMRGLRTIKPQDAISNANPRGLNLVMRASGPALLLGAVGLHSTVLGAVGVAEIGMHTFAKQILLDPRYARMAAKLPYLPANSSEALSITRMITSGALAGIATTVDGKQGVFQKDGSVKLEEDK